MTNYHHIAASTNQKPVVSVIFNENGLIRSIIHSCFAQHFLLDLVSAILDWKCLPNEYNSFRRSLLFGTLVALGISPLHSNPQALLRLRNTDVCFLLKKCSNAFLFLVCYLPILNSEVKILVWLDFKRKIPPREYSSHLFFCFLQCLFLEIGNHNGQLNFIGWFSKQGQLSYSCTPLESFATSIPTLSFPFILQAWSIYHLS